MGRQPAIEQTLKIFADERIAALDTTLARHGELIRLPGREIRPGHLKDADALFTRTVTTVDRALLEGAAVRFVGTATIGTDHLDTRYLENRGIRWSAAPGCNADATSQYTLATFLLACRRLRLNPHSLRYGIVGCGNVGGRLRRLLKTIGIDVIACDPPLAAQGLTGFRTMEDILDCDVISLHVPLTRGGQWPTHHMIDDNVFSQLQAGALLINACRGDVIDASALKSWMQNGGRAALDVWPGEPDIDPELIQLATVASPHIAGYSLEGKLQATSMVYRDFCEHFGISGFERVAPPTGPVLDVEAMAADNLEDIILRVCPVERDDQAIRDRLGQPGANRIQEYDALRSHYPERRDFAAWTLKGQLEPGLDSILKNLGFSVTNH
jgi:erythronate-4-phosphate dehydrogenase